MTDELPVFYDIARLKIEYASLTLVSRTDGVGNHKENLDIQTSKLKN
jgi:hypothetical protein